MMMEEEEASIVTSSGVFGQLQPLEESWDDIFGANDQTVCWLEQKLDEVESYLLSAASPELEPLEPVSTTSFPETIVRQDEAPAATSFGSVQQASPEEEAFLESAVVDADAEDDDVVDKQPSAGGETSKAAAAAAVGDVSQQVHSQESGEETDAGLEATVLGEMIEAISKLGTETRLCIRNALYRLAESATMRHGLQDSSSELSLSDDYRLGQTGKQAMEACTNSFDRSIANLLFHTSSRPTSTEQSSSVSPCALQPAKKKICLLPLVHKHRCAGAAQAATTTSKKKRLLTLVNRQTEVALAVNKLPAVKINKQLDYPSQPTARHLQAVGCSFKAKSNSRIMASSRKQVKL